MTKPTLPIALPLHPLPTKLPGATLPDGVLPALVEAGVAFSVDEGDRQEHGRDWWPLSIGWIANGSLPGTAGVVVRPSSTSEVAEVLKVATRFHVPVTPQGGRSGVVGGAVAVPGSIALDLTAMDRILEVDENSLTVTAQAGCFGPDLERSLNEQGLTLGHFPQSFDLSTVGGWLACRGAGQLSNRYGKIEDMVRGMEIVLADGSVIHTGGQAPRQAVGPDLNQLFVGSEGTLGIITEATLVLHRVAPTRREAAYSFASFDEGLEACRRIIQRDARPAVLRLYDEVESKRNFSIDRCALIVLDEGQPAFVDACMDVVADECNDAQVEDVSHVAKWLGHRNDVSSLTPLWERGIVVDTIEVAGSWRDLSNVVSNVQRALLAIPGVVVASVHQSHAYQDGACLYFTFAGKPEVDPDQFYRSAWDAASRAVLASGGALSHHHGIGRNRARFMREALGPAFSVLEALKTQLDPHNILNPGVLGIGGAAW